MNFFQPRKKSYEKYQKSWKEEKSGKHENTTTGKSISLYYQFLCHFFSNQFSETSLILVSIFFPIFLRTGKVLMRLRFFFLIIKCLSFLEINNFSGGFCWIFWEFEPCCFLMKVESVIRPFIYFLANPGTSSYKEQ